MQSVQSNRTPPTDMRVRLRTEVNFGCPICRSPFLAYHHFDPPWEPSHLHREEGMIALCSEHHNFADGGMYSADYLRKLKQSSSIEPPKGKLPWNAANAFISFGGNYCVTRQGRCFSFRVDGKNVFSLRLKEDGYLAVNASIFNSTNRLVCEIVENDILPNLSNLGDLRCSVQGKMVEIKSRTNEAYLSLKFDRIDENALLSTIRPKWPDTFSISFRALKTEEVRGFIRSILDEDKLCPVITIKSDVYSHSVPIKTLGNGISMDFRPLGYDRAIMTGYAIGEGAVRFVYSNRQEEKMWLGSESISKSIA